MKPRSRQGLFVLPVVSLVALAALLTAALLPPLPGAASVAGVSAAAQEPDPHLTKKERRELIQLLERSKAEFDRLVADVDGEAWSYRTAEDTWSVGDVAEHLLLAERLLAGRIESMLASEPDPDWPATTSLPVRQIIDRVSDRSQKFNAPEPIQPKREMDRETVLREFAAAREQMIRTVRETDAPVKQFTSPNPLFESANGQHWFAFVAGHNFRHNQQIAEIKAAMR